MTAARYSRASHLLLATIVLLCLAAEASGAVRKYYSRPLSFRYSEAGDQETSDSKHQDKHHEVDKNTESGALLEHRGESHVNKAKDAHKGYKSYQEHEGKDKEDVNKISRKDHFEEEKGRDGGKHEKAVHYKHREKGVKEDESAEFEEKADHQKGHSTKGEHNIFKKDEYEKKHDFYDEFYEDDGHEKHGGHREHHGGKNAEHHKAGQDKEEKYKGVKGRAEVHEHEHHHHKFVKDDHKNGDSENHNHHADRGADSARSHGKKWSYRPV